MFWWLDEGVKCNNLVHYSVIYKFWAQIYYILTQIFYNLIVILYYFINCNDVDVYEWIIVQMSYLFFLKHFTFILCYIFILIKMSNFNMLIHVIVV